MRIAVLSNIFKEYSNNNEVEADLSEVGNLVCDALKKNNHTVEFFDVNEKTFGLLANSRFDIAFNVCERFNGNSFHEPHVAAMLELLNIPYTGSGPLALALCMNKVRVKEIMMHHGIPTPKWQVFSSRNKKLNPELKFPLMVKPTRMDNSIGITSDSIVNNEKELQSQVGFILRTYNQPALVEEYIKGRDLDVGVLGNGNSLTCLPIMEVVFKNMAPDPFRIFSYEAKWDEKSDIYSNTAYDYPKDIPKYIELKIKRIATDLYKLLDLKDYGRVDIRLSEDNIPYVLEMNPNPGISCDCSTPMAAKSLGLEYHEMIQKILDCAVERYDLKKVPTLVAEQETPGQTINS